MRVAGWGLGVGGGRAIAPVALLFRRAFVATLLALCVVGKTVSSNSID